MNRIAYLLSLGLLATLTLSLSAQDDRWLTATEARKLVGQEVQVEVTIQTGKNRLEKRGEIYLDLELDFRDEKNLAIVITRDGAADFATQGIADPAEHFVNKTIRVTGKVSVQQDVPRIEVNSAKQITIKEAGK
jgi:hypothetical protein